MSLQKTGSVALVGGGPGHPDLITVRGRQLLTAADVVIADRLGPRALLDDLGPDTEVIDVGKQPHHHPVPQSRINELLVEHARAGKRVVRLKGGDPFVFGRGGEEAEFCRAAGIPVEVVPGVTSAIAVPSIAGIPVTHRGVAAGFTVLSAHTDIDEVPGGAEHTVVLLMGVSGLAATAATLAAGRRGADCPVAIVVKASWPDERVVRGTLGDIEAKVAAEPIERTALIFVGRTLEASGFRESSLYDAAYQRRFRGRE